MVGRTHHPAGVALEGKTLPPGFRKAWPEAVVAWKHSTGPWLTIQVLGPVAAVAWRVRPTYAVWPHEVTLFGESCSDADLNLAEARAFAEQLIETGPSEAVADAMTSARERNRINTANRYARKKAHKPPSSREMMELARDAVAKVTGIKRDKSDGGVVKVPQGRPANKTPEQIAHEAEVDKMRRGFLVEKLREAKFDEADCVAYAKGANPMKVLNWFPTPAGTAALREVEATVKMLTDPPAQSGEAA